MKTSKKSVTNKLVSRFDKELMSILMSDLKIMKARSLNRTQL
ncbi:hypothetical protein [Mucilaginibacter aquariorum]|jgi:hypothetical protein|uniref:Transcriptional regulator n=1 Tax=Mucilaginibacter aquariorum TaxID=2967225 RepID=A0ABT1T9M8_9SPHI|nr:hypothetical protein [Mucilaginibacter aquariorum]MCQ6961331.1 hypothetical protein [Mucilaginibacter aquariorum]